MIRSVFFASFNASMTLPKPEFIKVISALDIAVSVPVPIAIERSAALRAAASLIPSPIIKTVRPCDLNRSMISNFVAGMALARTCSASIPTVAATVAATSALSPVTSHGVICIARNALTVWVASIFNSSPTANTARATPSHARTERVNPAS